MTKYYITCGLFQFLVSANDEWHACEKFAARFDAWDHYSEWFTISTWGYREHEDNTREKDEIVYHIGTAAFLREFQKKQDNGPTV